MWIKICANTTLDDALAAAHLGADAVGFVFAQSPRQVTVEQVAAITPHLPSHVERIGVFIPQYSEAPAAQQAGTPESMDQEVARIASAALQSNLTGVQLHRATDPAFGRRLQQRLGPAFSIIQTVHWIIAEDARSEPQLAAQLDRLAGEPLPFRVLIDAQVGSASGGLGVPFPWERAQKVLAQQPTLRIIVAGGLRPENVAHAIRQLRPYGVDVASGVERRPGEKDHARLRSFLRAARARDHPCSETDTET